MLRMSKGMSVEDDPAALAAEIAGLVRAWQRAIDAHDDLVASRLGINRTDLRCLDAVLELGEGSAGAVGALARLSPATTTDAVTRLERAGLVERRRDPHDRRRVLVCSTAAAIAAAREAYAPLGEGGERLLRGLSREQTVAVRDFLRGALALQEEVTAALAAPPQDASDPGNASPGVPGRGVRHPRGRPRRSAP